jgi:hypothetical protein
VRLELDRLPAGHQQRLEDAASGIGAKVVDAAMVLGLPWVYSTPGPTPIQSQMEDQTG